MIYLKDISYAYSHNTHAVCELNLDVRPGELLGLVGANGSGKSTLLALMAGLFTPQKGAVLLDGKPLNQINRRVRLVLQDADLQIVGATTKEDLLLGREGKSGAIEQAMTIAERFALRDVWSSPIHSLSWGMKKKLCLAGAMLDKPDVLLLDEPFSGLDYPSIREMRFLIRANHEAGITQVIAAHDLESFVDLADSLAVLEKGWLVMKGAPEEVLDRVADFGVRPPCSWALNRTLVCDGEW